MSAAAYAVYLFPFDATVYIIIKYRSDTHFVAELNNSKMVRQANKIQHCSTKCDKQFLGTFVWLALPAAWVTVLGYAHPYQKPHMMSA